MQYHEQVQILHLTVFLYLHWNLCKFLLVLTWILILLLFQSFLGSFFVNSYKHNYTLIPFSRIHLKIHALWWVKVNNYFAWNVHNKRVADRPHVLAPFWITDLSFCQPEYQIISHFMATSQIILSDNSFWQFYKVFDGIFNRIDDKTSIKNSNFLYRRHFHSLLSTATN